MKWLGSGELNVDFRSLVAQGRRFQPEGTNYRPEPVQTKEDAVEELFRNVSMAVKPRTAFEDAEYFYFSGGTSFENVDDFRTGYAIQKATGEFIKWGN